MRHDQHPPQDDTNHHTTQQQNHQQSQKPHHHIERRHDIPEQDIRNAQWLTLSRDEDIIWSGHPSLLPHIPIITISVIAAILGLVIPFVVSQFGLVPLLLVPVGITGAAIEYVKVITTFYVVTNDKIVRKVGVIGRDTIAMRYEKIEHARTTQSVPERLLGFGDIEIATAGTGETEARLDNVTQPVYVSNAINQLKDYAYERQQHPNNTAP